MSRSYLLKRYHARRSGGLSMEMTYRLRTPEQLAELKITSDFDIRQEETEQWDMNTARREDTLRRGSVGGGRKRPDRDKTATYI